MYDSIHIFILAVFDWQHMLGQLGLMIVFQKVLLTAGYLRQLHNINDPLVPVNMWGSFFIDGYDLLANQEKLHCIILHMFYIMLYCLSI